MGLMDAQDELGRKVQQQRKLNKVKQEVTDEVTEKAKDELKRHEENQKEGMI
jgi:hypothetical protein